MSNIVGVQSEHSPRANPHVGGIFNRRRSGSDDSDSGNGDGSDKPRPLPGGSSGPPTPGGGSGSPPAPSDDADLIEGTDWRMHHSDPRTINEDMIYRREYGFNTIRPWTFPRSETGSRINYAVRFRTNYVEKEEFLNTFATQRLGTDNWTVKNYFYMFPKLAKSADRAQVCDFLHHVCRHSRAFGVYVPPFPTMVPENSQGRWYPDLADSYKNNWGSYDMILYQALTSSSAGLTESDLTRHLIHDPSGYQIIWRLAAIAGHPGLSAQVFQTQFPRQSSSLSLMDYTAKWAHYLHLQHCRGVTYSDTFYVEQWLENLHPSFDRLKTLGLTMVRDCPPDRPLPIHFAPDTLVSYLCERAVSIGIRDLTGQTTASSLRSTKTSRTTIAAVRQIDDNAAPLLDIRLLDEFPEELLAPVNSLMAASNGKECDFCKSKDHIIFQCPTLAQFLKDPMKVRRLHTILDNQVKGLGPLGPISRPKGQRSGSSSASAATVPSANRTFQNRTLMHMRQLDTDDDTDEDAMVAQLTDDEPSTSSEQEPDF